MGIENFQGNGFGDKTGVSDTKSTKDVSLLLEDDEKYQAVLTLVTEHHNSFGGGATPSELATDARAEFARQFPHEVKRYETVRVQAERERQKREQETNQTTPPQQAEDAVDDKVAQFETKRFQDSLQNFATTSIISQNLCEQLIEKRKTLNPDERKLFDTAIAEASYNFRIKGGNQETLVTILTAFSVSSEKDKQFEKKENKFQPITPRGWTNLKHGTNLLSWGDNNPFTVEKITLTRPLSVISQEDFDRDQRHGKGYNTTSNYSSASKPEGMSDAEFQTRNKPFEIRVMYFKNHARFADDEEYRSKLDKVTLDQIAKYYFLNMQQGRHPLVPKGETLIKLGHVQENGSDVFYFVPESVADVYSKESGVEIKKQQSEI